MRRVSLYALIPFALICLSFGTAFMDVCLTVAIFTALSGAIIRRQAAPSAVILISALIAFVLCGSSYAMCNKGFYKLLDEPVSLTCVVDETPIYTEEQIQFTAKMVSALCRGEHIPLDEKIMVFSEGCDADIKYGDRLEFKTDILLPSDSLNDGGFSYMRYLQAQSIQAVCYTYDFAIMNYGVYEEVNPVFYNIFRLRAYFLSKCDTYFDGDIAAFLKAMLLGYRGDMTAELKFSVTRSGISHIISVSGMHLSILMVILNFLFRRIRLKGSFFIIPILNTVSALFITALTGFSPSVKRAAAMLIISNSASVACRENDSLQSLSFALLILLCANPAAIHDVRLVLSAVSVLGIIIFNTPIDRFVKRHRLLRAMGENFSVTLSAQLISIPFSVAYFGTISVLGVVTNILVLPIVPFLMGAGFAFLIIPLQAVCSFLSGGIWLGVNAVVLISDLISAVPFAQVEIGFKRFCCIFILSTAAVFFISKTIRCRSRLKAIVCFTAACAAAILAIFPIRLREVDITAINVGQGDCTLIEFASGKTMLIDGGGSPISDYNTAKKIIRPYLVQNSITKIDYAVISHLHEDHANGIINLTDTFPVDCVIIPEHSDLNSGEVAGRLLEVCKRRDTPIYMADYGDSFYPDKDAEFKVYSPKPDTGFTANDSSLVFRLSAYGQAVLFTGDIEKPVRRVLAEGGDDIRADILKFPHHGDYSEADEAFINAVGPEQAYICVGLNNSYGHPNDEALVLLAKNKIQTLRTDLDRTIKFKLRRE